ncbi:MAG: hydantoinase/oxoprolinase family protein [Pseudomonadota bacterium]
MSYRLGVDIGGTFTDFCLLDESDQSLHTLKVLSTPEDPGQEVLTGIAALQTRYGIDPARIRYFTHGTTVGVNAVIQRKGIRLSLLTTRHFEDVLEVARLKMPDPYDLFSARPDPLVPRELVFSITGRMGHDGTVVEPVDPASVSAAVQAIRRAGAEGVVVALLHAYANPAHEQMVKAQIKELAPELFVSCSSDVWPVIREYERTVTAVVASYVQPRVSDYLEALERALADAGVAAPAMVTKSNGGVMSAAAGRVQCAQMLLSGTAAGVIGAGYVAENMGARQVLSLDIGGTSADVAIIQDGRPLYGSGELIGEFPIFVPTVAVSSIGEGGGSIAWVDDLGVLRVGPESAGSTPGPACYGRGGHRPTITDAFAACGYLAAGDLGYSAVAVDAERAVEAIAPLARALDLSEPAAAEAVINVAVSQMYLEVSKLLARDGADPRDMSLLAFGGAGPMLGCFVAREIGIDRLLIPTAPGVLSAFGGLVADIKNDFIRTVFLDVTAEGLNPRAADSTAALNEEALAWLQGEGVDTGSAKFAYSADMRYRGQSFEIDTPVALTWLTDGGAESLCAAFHDEHERVFGHADPDAAVQIVNLRLIVSVPVAPPRAAAIATASAPPLVSAYGAIYCDGTRRDVPFHRRDMLLAGHAISGPAVITQPDTTTCVLPGWHATVGADGTLLLEAASQ